MKKNILLTITYDGTGFHGWQRQPDELTVQGHLEKVLSGLFKTEIILNGTSRTDAGVHALGQRASFAADISIPVERLTLVINNALCGREKGSFALSPVRIISAEEKPVGFHARFDSKGKKYIYKIANTGRIDIFNRNYVYHVTAPLNIEAMKEAAEYIEGTHDFKSFEASGSNPRETTVRTIYSLGIVGGHGGNGSNIVGGYDDYGTDTAGGHGDDNPDIISSRKNVRSYRGRGNVTDSRGFGEPQGYGDIEIHVTGDGFLYNMVRIITGTLVDVGLGRIETEEVKNILNAKDRDAAGHTAPPYGLYLAEVYYESLMK